MLQNIDRILEEARQFKAETKEEIEQFRIKYLGKKGVLADLFRDFKEIPVEQKKETGQKINQLKQFISDKIESLHEAFTDTADHDGAIDLTLPGPPVRHHRRGPLPEPGWAIPSQKVRRLRMTGMCFPPSTSLRSILHVICRILFSLKRIRIFCSGPILLQYR